MKKVITICSAIVLAIVVFAQTQTEIKVDQLPKKVSEYVQKNMPGAKTERAMKEDNKGVINYYALVSLGGQNHILVFDKDGNFLKKGDNIFKESQKQNPPKTKPLQKDDKQKPEQAKPKK
jgi:hypothetical protein